MFYRFSSQIACPKASTRPRNAPIVFARSLALLCLLLASMLGYTESAKAQSCPKTQPDATIPTTQAEDGVNIYRGATLYDTQLNALGTVLLCRYRASLFSVSSRTGVEVRNGTYRFDRTVGGGSTPPNSWVVRLLDAGGTYRCSGAAITPDWVLTSRHCGEWVGPGTPVLGGTNATTQQCSTIHVAGTKKTICTALPPPAQTTTVQYPVEYLASDGTWKGDLMLLRLSRPLVLSQYAVPAVYGIDFDSNISCAFIFGLCNLDRWSGQFFSWAHGTTMTDVGYSFSFDFDVIHSHSIRFFRNSRCQTGSQWYTVDDALCGFINTDASDNATADPWYDLLEGDGGVLVYNNVIVGVYSDSSHVNGSESVFADAANNGSSLWIQNTVGRDLYSPVLPAQ